MILIKSNNLSGKKALLIKQMEFWCDNIFIKTNFLANSYVTFNFHETFYFFEGNNSNFNINIENIYT